MASQVLVCPVCSLKGITCSLRLYQINENEAVYMCTDKKCSYPIGVCDPATVIVKRPIPELQADQATLTDEELGTINDSNTETPAAQPTSSTILNNECIVPDDDDPTKNELDLMLEGILSEETNS